MSVKTLLTSKIAVYTLIVTAQYEIPVAIKSQVTFEVDVLDTCKKNKIINSNIPKITYNIGNSKLSFVFNSWSLDMLQCGRIKYVATD
jgi:hypothetical protein